MNQSVRIDFHSNVADKLLYACRLVRKARSQAADARLLLLTAHRQQMLQLDELLWTFSDLDFLPHVQVGHPLAAQTPVLLSCDQEASLPAAQILINLTSQAISQPQQFARIFEIVSQEPQDRQAGRERYRFYQQQGHTPTHIVAQ